MRCISKIENNWFERINAKFTDDELKIIKNAKDEELIKKIFAEFNKRGYKEASKEDVKIAEAVLSENNLAESKLTSVILPSCHGFAILNNKYIRF